MSKGIIVIARAGVAAIARERQRQIEVEGYTGENDANYVNGELTDAAICQLVDPDHRDTEPFPWPWSEDSWKPTPFDRIKELAKAGALIAAEIDRLVELQSAKNNHGTEQ